MTTPQQFPHFPIQKDPAKYQGSAVGFDRRRISPSLQAPKNVKRIPELGLRRHDGNYRTSSPYLWLTLNMSEVVQTLANTMGMEFLGFTIATWLFGVNTVQAYNYFYKSDDGSVVRFTVCAVVVLDVINTAVGSWAIYLEIIQNFGHLPDLNIPLTVQTVTGNIVVFIVQCFFARTIWHVSEKNKSLTFIIITLAVLSCLMGFAYPIQAYLFQVYSSANTLFSLVMFSVGIALPTLTDIVITISLVFYLQHDKVPIHSRSNVLHKLMVYFIQRGILLTVSQLVVVILVVCVSFTMAWSLVQYSLAKVYIYTLLILLNRRDDLRHGSTVNVDQMVPSLEFVTVEASRHDDGNAGSPPAEAHGDSVGSLDNSACPSVIV